MPELTYSRRSQFLSNEDVVSAHHPGDKMGPELFTEWPLRRRRCSARRTTPLMAAKRVIYGHRKVKMDRRRPQAHVREDESGGSLTAAIIKAR